MSNNLMKSAGNFILKHTVKVRKYAPEILTGVAAVGTVVGTVMACKATTKLEPIIDDAKEQLDDIHEAVDENNPDAKKEIAHVYISTGLQVAKLYAPSAGVIAVSLASMIASTGISRKREVSLAAAYAALSKAYSDYRGKIAEKFGVDAEKDICYNVTNDTLTETVEDEETGKKKKVRKTVKSSDGTLYSPYAFFFDDVNSTEWKDDPQANLYFLNCQQRYMNDLVRARGWVTLAEIKHALGCDACIEAGDIHVGITYKPNHPTGDNYVDFGIFNVNRPAVKDFLEGKEPSIIIEPNVEGYIYEIRDR